MLTSICPFSNRYSRLSPNLSSHLAKVIEHPCPLNDWSSFCGTGRAHGCWVTAPSSHSELPRRPKYQAIWERYKSFMLPCSVLPPFCAVCRLVCEACVQADRISCPAGPTALPRVYLPHPVDVPCVGLSNGFSFTHTFSEQLISNIMHALRI